MKFYSKKETAAILGISTRTIERYLLAGKLKGARLSKGWMISDEDIKTFYDDVKRETAEVIKKRNG
jgi:excisionase family DNA binding protein